jgi:hypothetical protein
VDKIHHSRGTVPRHPPRNNRFLAGSPKSRNTHHYFRKDPLTKKMLLPLPVTKARTVSLENHLALVRCAMFTGTPMSCLLKTVYLACFLYEALPGRSVLEPFARPSELSYGVCRT